ncbi:helix-turn-helix domain-containing protein [Janthinobacterium sp. ROICE36]|uniref:helix-turn-helix domain-containing protein n=1 Tax=Janthinobacterium sp. ROICE36 TaxID=2048670 RepID=UPI0015E1216B|nr:LuxR C-terminal-related transcriptional regulator [Janthinobacterium sp. ROICE36]
MQRLTPAERLVATMAAEGLPYKSIARELRKSPATVRNQLHAIYQKLGVGNRTALACKLCGKP